MFVVVSSVVVVGCGVSNVLIVKGTKAVELEIDEVTLVVKVGLESGVDRVVEKISTFSPFTISLSIKSLNVSSFSSELVDMS